MGTLTVQACCSDDEDYIDMEVSSSSYSSNFLCYSSSISSSPPHQTSEFEFQFISSSTVPHQDNKEATTTTSPADELFYKGKLLPLHLPPRLQMVQKLLRNSVEEEEEHNFPIPFVKNTSESESCRVSSEINPDEYLFEWSCNTEIMSAQDQNNLGKKSSRTKKKLQQIKQYFVLSQKLKASRAYLKSLFIKPGGCSDESSAAQYNDCLNKCIKRNPLGTYDYIDRKIVEDGGTTAIQRRSFSGAIQWHSSTTRSSSSSSSSSTTCSGSSSFSFSSNNGIYDVQLLKRSTSANSEIESSIEGAIAHCKNSLSICC